MSDTASPGPSKPPPGRHRPGGGTLIPAAILAVVLALSVPPPGAAALSPDEQNNVEVYRRAAPGVVNITSITVDYDFFLRPVPREGAGSGVIIDERGYILTNNHVIKNARRLEVTLSDRSKYRGYLVGAYPEMDLAVIRVEAAEGSLTAVPLGDSSSLVVGQKVLAIGNPFGLGETLTTGIISSLGRSVSSPDGVLLEDLIQTDASINPGNSGGPLLDTEGRIIGLNTAILSPSGGSVGIGFAVPVDEARRILPDLIQKGRVAYPWMGVSMFPLFPALAQALELSVERGVMITEVVPGGPADVAGLSGATRLLEVGNARLPAGGDVVTEADGKPVESPEELTRILRRKRPGDQVTLTVASGGRMKKMAVTLTERPPDDSDR